MKANTSFDDNSDIGNGDDYFFFSHLDGDYELNLGLNC